MTKEILIKKYGNRRLYDTRKSVYISLNQLAELIKQGVQVKVIDVQTGENVTAYILTQVLLEEVKKNGTLLPVPLLCMIIQYGDILTEFFEKYLQQTLKNYISYKTTFDDQFKKWLELGADFTSMGEKTADGLTSFKSFFELFSHSLDTKKNERN
jgi:polyhydroxyalkanoate synthesis repressor PhaR